MGTACLAISAFLSLYTWLTHCLSLFPSLSISPNFFLFLLAVLCLLLAIICHTCLLARQRSISLALVSPVFPLPLPPPPSLSLLLYLLLCLLPPLAIKHTFRQPFSLSHLIEFASTGALKATSLPTPCLRHPPPGYPSSFSFWPQAASFLRCLSPQPEPEPEPNPCQARTSQDKTRRKRNQFASYLLPPPGQNLCFSCHCVHLLFCPASAAFNCQMVSGKESTR